MLALVVTSLRVGASVHSYLLLPLSPLETESAPLQRPWGTPIPIVHCDGACQGPVLETRLPVLQRWIALLKP